MYTKNNLSVGQRAELYTKPYLNYAQMLRDTEGLSEVVISAVDGDIISVYQNQYVLVAYKLDNLLSQVKQYYRCNYGEFFDTENERCVNAQENMVINQKIIAQKQQDDYLLEGSVDGHAVYTIVSSCPPGTEPDSAGYCKQLQTGENSPEACPALKPYYF